MSDCLGKELKINDFVTSVFSDGELTLFKISGFQQHTTDYFQQETLYKTENSQYIVLKRLSGTKATVSQNHFNAKQINSKPVYKRSSQVAYTDPTTAENYIFVNQLEQ